MTCIALLLVVIIAPRVYLYRLRQRRGERSERR